MYSISVVFLLLRLGSCLAQLTNDKDLLLNWCLNSTLHKTKPGKEDVLHKQCLPWKERACCTENTTRSIHEEDVHNFNLNHCYNKTQKNLSDPCRQYFDRDNCFYECEPHIGLWVVSTKRKIATERFLHVPLCASDCNAWWDACKHDHTCAYNWPRNFKFRKDVCGYGCVFVLGCECVGEGIVDCVNYCPENSTCQTFESMYGDAKSFCENVWDHSWKYTSDDEPCMRMWFNGTAGNPNRNTAEYYIKLKFGAASVVSVSSFILLVSPAIILLSSKHLL